MPVVLEILFFLLLVTVLGVSLYGVGFARGHQKGGSEERLKWRSPDGWQRKDATTYVPSEGEQQKEKPQ